MVRDPVWWSSFSLSLNLSVPPLHWTSVQILLWSTVICAMRVSLKYHLMSSCCFVWTPVYRVTESPSITDTLSAPEAPEEEIKSSINYKPNKITQHRRVILELWSCSFKLTQNKSSGGRCRAKWEELELQLHLAGSSGRGHAGTGILCSNFLFSLYYRRVQVLSTSLSR